MRGSILPRQLLLSPRIGATEQQKPCPHVAQTLQNEKAHAMKHATIFCSLSLLLSVPCGVALAQEPPSQVGAVNAQAGDMTGQQFAEAMMTSDMFEIQSGKLASEQADSPRVRQFGQQMVDDHSQSTAHLKSVLDRVLVGQYVTPPPKLDPRHMEMYNALQGAHGPDF